MESQRRILMLMLAAVWVVVMNRGVQAGPHVCSEACSEATCDAECWETQPDYDNGAPPTTCGEEGYECCGDGVCNDDETCGICEDDCGPTGATCPSECLFDFNCEGDEVCNASRQCVQPAPNNTGSGDPSCSNKGDCYEPDACMEGGECALPWKDECDGQYVCTNTPDCQSHFSDPDSYCNPGNNHCMNKSSPGCTT